jgi:hypothetical protein
VIFSRKLSIFLWNPDLKTPVTGTILNYLNPQYALPPYFLRISSILSSHLFYVLASYMTPCGFLHKFLLVFLTYDYSASPTRQPAVNLCQSVGKEAK